MSKSTLKGEAARYAHLAAIPAAPKASAAEPGAEDAARLAASVVAATPAAAAASPAAPIAATAPPKKDSDPENEDEEDEDDEDEKAEDDDEMKKAKAAGFGKALRAAQRNERRRCSAIFRSNHAQGRIPMACRLAFQMKNAMSAPDAVNLLAAAPAAQPTNVFAAAMAAEPTHTIGQDRGPAAAENPGDRLFAVAKKFSGNEGGEVPSALKSAASKFAAGR